MRVIRGLGDKNPVRRVGGLDEVMRAYINHDLGAGQNLDIELLLQMVERLQPRMNTSVSNLHRRAYIKAHLYARDTYVLIVVHLHVVLSILGVVG